MQSSGIEPQVTQGPLLGCRIVVATKTVGPHQNTPLPQRSLRRSLPELEQCPAIVIPTANNFKPILPPVIKRLAYEQPSLPSHARIEPLSQCTPFPIVPRVMQKLAAHHLVKIQARFWNRWRRSFQRRRQDGSEWF